MACCCGPRANTCEDCLQQFGGTYPDFVLMSISGFIEYPSYVTLDGCDNPAFRQTFGDQVVLSRVTECGVFAYAAGSHNLKFFPYGFTTTLEPTSIIDFTATHRCRSLIGGAASVRVYQAFNAPPQQLQPGDVYYNCRKSFWIGKSWSVSRPVDLSTGYSLTWIILDFQ